MTDSLASVEVCVACGLTTSAGLHDVSVGIRLGDDCSGARRVDLTGGPVCSACANLLDDVLTPYGIDIEVRPW